MNMKPELAISRGQARPQVKGVGNKPSHIPCNLQSALALGCAGKRLVKMLFMTAHSQIYPFCGLQQLPADCAATNHCSPRAPWLLGTGLFCLSLLLSVQSQVRITMTGITSFK